MDPLHQLRDLFVLVSALASISYMVWTLVQFLSLPSQRSRRVIFITGIVGCVSTGLLAGWASGMRAGWVVGLFGHVSAGFIVGTVFLCFSAQIMQFELDQKVSSEDLHSSPSALNKTGLALWSSIAILIVSSISSIVWARFVTDNELKLVALILPFFTIALSLFALAAVQYRGVAAFAVVALIAVIAGLSIGGFNNRKSPTQQEVQSEMERSRQMKIYQQAMSEAPMDRLSIATKFISNGMFKSLESKPDDDDLDLLEMIQLDTPFTGVWRADIADFNDVELSLTIHSDRTFLLETINADQKPQPLAGKIFANDFEITYELENAVISIFH